MKTIQLQKATVNVSIQEGFEQFIKIKRTENISKATIIYYKDNFRRFSAFFGEDKYCHDITPTVIEDYLAQYADRETKSTTINSYLRGIRVIIYFFMEREYTPQFKIKLIKQEKKLKETYTDIELEKLLKKPDIKKCDFAEYRNWAITNYLLATGNRLSTVCDLRIRDIDFHNNEIMLTKLKNRRQYIIPLSARLAKVLREYLLYRKGEQDDFLFCNKFGAKLKENGISSAIERYNNRRGVAKTSIHLYRHTFAKNWILNGGDIFRLKSILGHSSIDIVKEYAEMFGSDLKHNFDKFNPLDNFGEQTTGRTALKMVK